jgi:NADH-quinone oxidoreductase subunit J
MAEAALFFLIAVIAIASAIGMLIARNPVSSALWLVLNFFCIASAYILLQAEFIGVIQILVYAGAIMVLFLFVMSPGVDASEMGSAKAIGKELFTRYAFLLEVIAVLLLAATIGAVLLAKKRFV